MRHTPCGCAPYGEGAFHIRRARPLGVPSAKRQTVQTNRFVRSRKFLHRWGHVPTLQRSVLICNTPVGRGHVPADREAADGRHEQVCTYSVVPALA